MCVYVGGGGGGEDHLYLSNFEKLDHQKIYQPK